MGVYEPHGVGQLDEEDLLAHGFDRPFGAGRLRHEVGPTSRVLVLIDDLTRGTPVPRLLKRVLGELCEAGVLDRQIQVLTAQGTHRKMTQSELHSKLGEFHGRFEVHQHHWLDESQLHEFGHTSDGTCVTANRLLDENDFVIGLGSIVPHRVMGFSSGAKIAFPGVSGREVQERCQWQAAQHPSESVMGNAENPMRLRIEEHTSADRSAGLARCTE